MAFRTMLVAALVLAPMVTMPADVSAQDRGAERSEAAAARGAADQQAEQRPDGAPAGLQKAFEGRTPPAALERQFPGIFSEPEPEPAAEPTSEPEPAPEDDCETSLELVGGEYVLVDCEGNVADPSEMD
ncbi:MAG: hypothetical protein U5R14_02380 [Gemmatimonadota bacterium]|nr:hypothetical protein [Gemmatimonadota bacterium]